MKEIGGQNGLLSEIQNTHSNKSTLIPLFLASLSCLCQTESDSFRFPPIHIRLYSVPEAGLQT